MTDEQIIKALEKALRVADETINRQRAEIERLEVELRAMRGAANCYKMHYEKAIKEIERLKAEIERKNRILDSYALQYGTVADKDVLLKRAKAEAVKEFCDKRGIEYVETDI